VSEREREREREREKEKEGERERKREQGSKKLSAQFILIRAKAGKGRK
jgi:hypothetical protein